MNSTWVMAYPNGTETGRVLTLDMGGTNLRVCDVSLAQGRGEADQIQRKYKLTQEIKNATSEQLWDWVADRVTEFIHEHHSGGQGNYSFPLAFTFSFPVEQKNIRSGILQRWTKDFNVSGVEGHDIIPQLEAAFERKVGHLIPGKSDTRLIDTESSRASCGFDQRHNRDTHCIALSRPRSENRMCLQHRVQRSIHGRMPENPKATALCAS